MSDNQRTRPSEAEVTEAMESAFVRGFNASALREDFVALPDAFLPCVRAGLAAALSTPPLPSAEPVAWQCVVCDEVNPATKMHCGRCGTLGMRATTPPAAAQEAPC